MSQYCSQCGAKLAFMSPKAVQSSVNGSSIRLCRQCRQDVVKKYHSRFSPFRLSEGYTRIEATVLLDLLRIPRFCVVCSSEKELLAQGTVSVSYGLGALSIPLYECQECTGAKVYPSHYIRYRLSGGNLTLDIGNPTVAEKYHVFLMEELSNIKHNLETRTDPIEFLSSGGATIPFSPDMLRGIAAGLGVQEVRRISPSDVDFQK